MKTTLKLALGAVLSAAVIMPAVAQDNFPDVPGEHWAYEALARMKREGLLVGYPDGLFRGNRPASRYEMAVAIHATYAHLKGLIDGINAQIDELKGRSGGGDTQSLRDALTALQNDVNNMKSWGDDVANLKKMASMFEKELASLGVNVEEMKKDLADLEDRVGRLEKNALPLTIHGDVNVLAMGGISSSNRAFLGQDGRLYGVNPFSGGFAGLTQDLNIFHEAALRLAGTNETGPKWGGTIVFANTMPGAGGTGAGIPGAVGVGGFTEAGSSDIWVDDLSVTFDTSVGGQGFSAQLGRFGYKVSPYIYQKSDSTPYYANERWDDGKWRMDGANLGFKFGAGNLNVLFGREAGLTTSNGIPLQLQPGAAGAFAGTMMGAHLAVPVMENGKVNLAYIWRESNGPIGGNFGRQEVFGGDVNMNWQNFWLGAGYSQSNIKVGGLKVTKNNYAWNVNGGWKGDRWGLEAGYREIMPDFTAPGDWGRIGFLYNLTDHRGFNVGAHFSLSDSTTLRASGEFYEGSNKVGVLGGPALVTGDKINRYTASLDYKLNDAWSAMLGGEWVDLNWAGATPTDKMRWYNVGFGYAMSEMAKLNFMWQMSDHAGAAGSPIFGTTKFTGSLITTQLTVKF